MSAELRAFTGTEHKPYFLQGRADAAALLVHGFPGTPAELRHVGDMIHGAGLSVEGMLLPGFGTEFLNVADYHNEDWLAAVLQAVDALRNRFAHVLLVGNSMGASLAIQAATECHVDGLLLFAPWWRVRQQWFDRLFSMVQPLLPTIHPFRRANFSDERFRTALLRFLPDANLDDPEVQQTIRALEIRTSVIAEVRRVGRLGGEAAGAVAAPTLVIQGTRDILVHPSITAELARRFPNLVGLATADADHEMAHMDDARSRDLQPLIAHFATMIAELPHTGAGNGPSVPSQIRDRQSSS